MRWTLMLFVIAGCARPQVASPHEVELEQRVDALTLRVEALEQKQAAAPAAARGERPRPDPEAVYAVDISDDPFIGPADALVTVVKAQDYACRFCARSEPTMAELLAAYPGKLRVVYKDFVVHPDEATVPAHAACAANLQGHFAAFNDALWTKAFGNDTSEAKMLELARELKLDVDRFTSDMRGPVCRAGVSKDMHALIALGVSGTPAFFINGRFLEGAQPLARFRTLVDEELAKAEARVNKDGVTAGNYYQRVVVGEGRKTL